ncbi:MAG: hypothetical protein ABSE73_30650 [Planctomycetota bacterium]
MAGGEHHAPFLDFDLLKLHPQMVNHGMGYYERWFERGYAHRWGHDTGTPEQVDKYRAQEIAYGHAGFIGSAQTSNIQWVAKEHHILHALQALYGTAKAAEVSYEIEGQFVSGGVALVLGERSRQRIKYDSGLTLWVNWGAAPWSVQDRTLPQWGFLALGPGTEAYTELRDGKFADFVACPEYVFVDARTSFNMPYLQAAKDIEPRLRELKHLGGGKISVTYEWRVNDTLDQDYHCFVHFTSPQSKNGDEIEFQQDHALPKPTNQWQKGETVVDGPYEISVPADGFDQYDLTIGLYKGERVSLKGLSLGGSRILLARLKLQRAGGKVTDVTLGDLSSDAKLAESQRADFRAHLNPAGTKVNFGKIETDGSVKIQKGKGVLTVLPYPRDVPIHLSFDLKALAPDANPERVAVRALAAGTLEEMGKVAHELQDGRLILTLGLKGAGRYVISY